MRVPGFAPGAGQDDVNLALWRWSDRRPSRVAPIDDEGRLTSTRRSGPLRDDLAHREPSGWNAAGPVLAIDQRLHYSALQ